MRRNRERGAVSIFIVIFTALLVTVVTASFIQLMIRNQQQASNNDLSQRAYDSAMAGVEDAKRALVALKSCDNDSSTLCSNLRSALINRGKTDCQILGDNSVNVATFTNGEVVIGDVAKNQAYTCVRVTVNTASYKGHLEKNTSVVIPLHSEDPTDLSIVGVRISWFSTGDVNPTAPATYPIGTPLPKEVDWPVTRPPIMRSQLIQFQRGNLSLNSFDTPGNPNAKTLFLYPSRFGGNQNFDSDGRLSTGSRNNLATARCDTTYTQRGYACSTDVTIPALTGIPSRNAYLQLTSLYNAATYEIQLLGANGTIINFNNVQPNVDSTGRASDLFRRVSARVSIKDGFSTQYPDAALYLGKSLCKDFFVTNKAADYNGDATGNGTCEPSN